MYRFVLREDLITKTILFLLVGWGKISVHFSDNGNSSYMGNLHMKVRSDIWTKVDVCKENFIALWIVLQKQCHWANFMCIQSCSVKIWSQELFYFCSWGGLRFFFIFLTMEFSRTCFKRKITRILQQKLKKKWLLTITNLHRTYVRQLHEGNFLWGGWSYALNHRILPLDRFENTTNWLKQSLKSEEIFFFLCCSYIISQENFHGKFAYESEIWYMNKNRCMQGELHGILEFAWKTSADS